MSGERSRGGGYYDRDRDRVTRTHHSARRGERERHSGRVDLGREMRRRDHYGDNRENRSRSGRFADRREDDDYRRGHHHQNEAEDRGVRRGQASGFDSEGKTPRENGPLHETTNHLPSADGSSVNQHSTPSNSSVDSPLSASSPDKKANLEEGTTIGADNLAQAQVRKAILTQQQNASPGLTSGTAPPSNLPPGVFDSRNRLGRETPSCLRGKVFPVVGTAFSMVWCHLETPGGKTKPVIAFAIPGVFVPHPYLYQARVPFSSGGGSNDSINYLRFSKQKRLQISHEAIEKSSKATIRAFSVDKIGVKKQQLDLLFLTTDNAPSPWFGKNCHQTILIYKRFHEAALGLDSIRIWKGLGIEINPAVCLGLHSVPLAVLAAIKERREQRGDSRFSSVHARKIVIRMAKSLPALLFSLADLETSRMMHDDIQALETNRSIRENAQSTGIFK